MSVCKCIFFSGKQINWNWNWNFHFHFQIFSNLYLFQGNFWPNSVQQTQTVVSTKMCAIELLVFIVHHPSFDICSNTNRSSVTLIIKIFPIAFQDCQLLHSMTFQAWKMKLLNFITFKVFHDLYEPCNYTYTLTW